MKKSLVTSILITLLILTGCTQPPAASPTPESATETPAPTTITAKEFPTKGDCVITGDKILENGAVILNGNLIVQAGSRLTLRKVNLQLNCQYDGQYTIKVESGGSMFVYDSTIASKDLEHRFAFVVSGSAFEMKDSRLHGCGWSQGKSNDDEAKGLLIKTPGAVLENNIISENFIGLVLLDDQVIVKGNTLHSNEYVVLEVFSSNNTITGNSIKHETTFDSFIIIMGMAHNNTIIDNVITQEPLLRWQNMGAIVAWHSWNNIIANNTIDVDWPIGMVCSSNNVIRNNTFISREVGVWIRAGVNNRIEYNDLQLEDRGESSTRFGILLIYAHDNVVASNDISGTAKFGFGTIYLDHSNRNHVLNNQLSTSTPRSIFLLASKDNTLSGNQVANGEIGLFLYYGANSNRIFNNSITSELNSIIVDTSSENLIHSNNFSSLAKKPYDNGVNKWYHEGNGNYWNDYHGNDDDGNGIGDVPYAVAPDGIDRYPLLNVAEVTSSPVFEMKPVSFTEGPQFLDVDKINVDGEMVIDNKTLRMKAGTIEVQSTGSLVIKDSTLILGGTGPVDIQVSGGGSIHIERSVIKAAEAGYGFQIKIKDGSTLVMKDSELHGACWDIGNGLFIEGAKSAVIENNVIAGSHTGMYLGHVGSARIVNNVLEGNGQAIIIDTTSNVLIEGNIIDGTVWSAIQVVAWEEVHDIKVVGNTILHSWGTGIEAPSNVIVENNEVIN